MQLIGCFAMRDSTFRRCSSWNLKASASGITTGIATMAKIFASRSKASSFVEAVDWVGTQIGVLRFNTKARQPSKTPLIRRKLAMTGAALVLCLSTIATAQLQKPQNHGRNSSSQTNISFHSRAYRSRERLQTRLTIRLRKQSSELK